VGSVALSLAIAYHTFHWNMIMRDYTNAPKREPMRRSSRPVGSLTDNRRHWAPKIAGAKRRKHIHIQRETDS
jgi:hypothetical protein